METIRKMTENDKSAVFDMMRVFYNSPAVFSTPSDEILMKNISDCVSELPFIEGYVFEENGQIIGYSMVAKSYSTEFGGICIWVEDLYLVAEYRHCGIGTKFFKYIQNIYKDTVVLLRLEVEEENKNAVKAYEKNGFSKLPYIEMIKKI